MWKTYEFSPKSYVKANLIKIILINSLLIALFIFMLWLNSTLTIGSALGVILIFSLFALLLIVKLIGIRSGSSLEIGENCISYHLVKQDGFSGNLRTYRYEEDVYCIYKVDKYVIKSSKIIIYGVIKKDERRERNSYKNSKSKDVKSVKIPMYFSEPNDFIQKLKEFKESGLIG